MNFLKTIAVFLVIIAALSIVLWFSGGDSKIDEISIAEKQIGMELDSQRVDVGDVTLHVIFAGPEDGVPIILMHGFPEFWFAWRQQIAILAQAGFRVAAPDLRGYNRSDKPAGIESYTQRAYASDILGLMDSQGWQSANIAAHDIGAGVAWRMIFENADRVRTAVIFSISHPLAFEAVGNDSDISWYRDFLKLPLVPELFTRAGGLALMKNNLVETSRSGSFSESDLKVYEMAWDRDHAIDTMIGAYRADNPPIDNIPDGGKPTMPVMLIFGEQDKFISTASANKSREFLGDDNVLIYPDLSHWMLAEEPELMAQHIATFVQSTVSSSEEK